MDFKDLYKILQVDSSAEPEIITAAYKRLALKYHPDTNPAPTSMQRMQEINNAYEILSDPTRRRQFDRLRERALNSTIVQDSHAEQDRKTPIHQSDFSSPSSIWSEYSESNEKAFIKDGFYHIAVSNGPDVFEHKVYQFLPFQVRNFKLFFEAQISDTSDKDCEYGIVFHTEKVETRLDYYVFGITTDEFSDLDERATFYLYLYKNQGWYSLTDHSEAGSINSRKWHFDWSIRNFVAEANGGWARENKYMIAVKDNRITLGANGKILTRVNDDRLLSGAIGLFVSVPSASQAEVRFHNFRLYSQ